MLGIKIENIIGVGNIAYRGISLDMDEAAKILGAQYDPEQFPGLIYNIPNPRSAMLLFENGKSVSTGVKKTEDLDLAFDAFCRKLNDSGLIVRKDPEIQISNFVVSVDLGEPLNLDETTRSLPAFKVEYDPSSFPGIIYHINSPRAVVLMFKSGKLIITGAKSKEDVKKIVEDIVKELNDAGVTHVN